MAAATRKQQHVVAVPLPAQGHLNSLMRFCKLLMAQQEDIIVTFVDCDPIHHRLQQLQIMSTTSDLPPPSVDYSHFRRAHIPIHGLDLSNSFNLSFRTFYDSLSSIAPYLEHLILSLNPPVTCLLFDLSMTCPSQDVADKLGIPTIVLYPCCASSLLFTHYLSQGSDPNISIPKVMEAILSRKREELFCKGLPGLPTLYNKDLPHFRHVMDETLSLLQTFVELWRVCNARAHAVVVNSFEGLEASTFNTLSKACDLPIYDVGFWMEPLHKESATSLWEEDNSCIPWLDQQPTSSVLYISFGSITCLSQDQFEELLSGLLSSQQRFLWVFRPGLVENSIDYSSSVASIMSKSEGKGFVINWAPQLQVLAHPSVGGFLTHCGWNSTSESIAHGVPMLCWPYFADQTLTARCIADEWKVGLGFESSEEDICFIKRDEIEKVIRALMEGDEGKLVRQNVTNLKAKSYECLLENGSSYMNLMALINSLP